MRNEIKGCFNMERMEQRMAQKYIRKELAEGEGLNDIVLRTSFAEVNEIVSVENMDSFFPPLKNAEIGEPLKLKAKSAAKRIREEIRRGQRTYVRVDLPPELVEGLKEDLRAPVLFNEVTLPIRSYNATCSLDVLHKDRNNDAIELHSDRIPSGPSAEHFRVSETSLCSGGIPLKPPSWKLATESSLKPRDSLHTSLVILSSSDDEINITPNH
jgi:hypothetical protein